MRLHSKPLGIPKRSPSRFYKLTDSAVVKLRVVCLPERLVPGTASASSCALTPEPSGRIMGSPFQGGLMRRSSEPRKTVSLCESVLHQLNLYALAASAAGVGMFALAQASEA